MRLVVANNKDMLFNLDTVYSVEIKRENDKIKCLHFNILPDVSQGISFFDRKEYDIGFKINLDYTKKDIAEKLERNIYDIIEEILSYKGSPAAFNDVCNEILQKYIGE